MRLRNRYPHIPVRMMLLLIAVYMWPVHVLAQYGGPSMLSRGGNQPGRRGRAPVDFTYYVSANGRYETGLLSPNLNASGEIVPVNSYGAGIEFGLFGGHDWRRQSVGVDYRGDYRYDTQYSNFNGMSHAISLEYDRILTRRVRLTVRETGGTTNRAFGGFVAPAFAEAGRFGVPLNEVFDVRTYYSQTDGFVSWQKTARTSIVGGGQIFFLKRESFSLTNAQGGGALFAVRHRISRRNTLGFEYQYYRFSYPHVLSFTNVHMGNVRFGRTLTRSVSADVSVGMFNLASSGTEEIQLSPAVAAILGRNTGLAAFRRSFRKPSYEASISYTQERGRYYLNIQTGAGAGNGVFLATTRTTANTGYSYTGIRRASLGLSAGYSRISSASLDLPSLTQWQGGGGAAYQLRPHLNATAQFDYRTFHSAATPGRDGFVLTIGLGYSSSTLPLSIW